MLFIIYEGTTNLHVDISDAVNTLVHVSIPDDNPRQYKHNLNKVWIIIKIYEILKRIIKHIYQVLKLINKFNKEKNCCLQFEQCFFFTWYLKF